ncbi:GntR family transcriptional regulator [Acuticoccus sp. I52.16.1]|uniref:GntR family transcriptional regulator n=1 Tax=Acuticoccus sp. I52.16.1 TaxID=2928472 RepID=UPI001FD4713A|nr:GntR family transcriptional regulator [Acuticoccus sp. I52.16.1]UOM34357.1 GntR family transcriptional regulator [Acuticoccus sp. I52.16.1]
MPASLDLSADWHSPPQTTERPGEGVPAAQRVLAELRDMIIRGDLAPGSRIVERTLCARLHVSRTPMREALKLLEIDGLIEISQNRGARVLEFTPGEALELFEVLSSLEGVAAELATQRMTESMASYIGTLHEAMRTHYTARDRDAYFDCNSLIHEAIVEAAGNRTLLATWHSLMRRAQRGRYMAIVSATRWHQAMDEHEALMAALHARDAAEAGRVWRLHLMHTGETIAGVMTDAAPAGRD